MQSELEFLNLVEVLGSGRRPSYGFIVAKAVDLPVSTS